MVSKNLVDLRIFRLRIWKWIFLKRLSWLLTFILYLMLLNPISGPRFWALILILFFYFSCGILLNDYFDRPYDKKIGKETGISQFSKLEVFLGILITAFGFLVLSYLISSFGYLFLVLGLLFGSLYSGARFKEKGVYGVIFNSLSELAPLLFIFSIFGLGLVKSSFLALFYFFVHLTDTTNHQLIEDYEKDKELKLGTLAIKLGKKRTKKLIKWLSLITAYLSFIVYFLFFEIKYFGFIFIFLVLLYFFHPLINEKIEEEFVFKRAYVDFVLLGVFGIIPIYLSVFLVLKNIIYISVTAFTFLCSYNFLKEVFNRVKCVLQSATTS